MAISETVGNIAIACAAVTAVAQIIDWLLPARATKSIQSALEHGWYRLSELQPQRLVRILGNRGKLTWAIYGLGAASFALGVLAVFGTGPVGVSEAVEILSHFFPGFLLTLGIALPTLPAISGWISKKETAQSTLLRMTGLWILAVSCCFALYSALNFVSLDAGIAIFCLGGIAALAFFVSVLFAGLLIWFLIIGLGQLILRIIEFLMLRLAEHPKGPVIGMSVLVAAVGALFKSFN